MGSPPQPTQLPTPVLNCCRPRFTTKMKLYSITVLGLAATAASLPAKSVAQKQALKLPQNLSQAQRMANTGFNDARKQLRAYGFNINPSVKNNAKKLLEQQKSALAAAAQDKLESARTQLAQAPEVFINPEAESKVDLAALKLIHAKAMAKATIEEYKLAKTNLETLKNQGVAMAKKAINENVANVNAKKLANTLFETVKKAINKNTAAFDKLDFPALFEMGKNNIAPRAEQAAGAAKAKITSAKNIVMKQFSLAHNKCAKFVQNGAKCKTAANNAVAELKSLGEAVGIDEIMAFAKEQMAKIDAAVRS